MQNLFYHADLGGAWQFRAVGEDRWQTGQVPGSVVHDLVSAGLLEDPFWRENESQATRVTEKDWEYVRTFMPPAEVLESPVVELVCEGLDTLAEVRLNGILIAETASMHRVWRWDIRSLLTAGENTLSVTFRSPNRYIAEAAAGSDITYTAKGSMKGNGFIRKAHSMFGWDWGPQIPDAGIWRDIRIEARSAPRLDNFKVLQHHSGTSVRLNVSADLTGGPALPGGILRVTLAGPDGVVLVQTDFPAGEGAVTGSLTVENPQLWWPHGYGSQPLYNLSATLTYPGGTADATALQLGLRTMTVSTEKDTWGEEFAFCVNGVKIFAMGADYVPMDSLIPRITSDKMEKLISDCARANFNCIRVWGGAYYPEDDFFRLCDVYGMVVWQDLMFACNVYVMSDAFADNIREEIIQNVRRIRHHACLGLWCGNNEMEWGWVDWDRVKYHSPKLKADYIKQFEVLIPGIMAEEDPQNFFWPASPSSGGCFDNPNDGNRGDVHDWAVWHELQPFTDYRKAYYRFCSEFGFQAFPSIETVETFTLPEDRNIFSPVMENHQKHPDANGRILFYLSDLFRYPAQFDDLLYVSQLLQMEAVRHGVEHWRRYRGRCMGAVYWQLNDCWPVASWASVDYFGRWKALQYGAKRFFSPLLASVEDQGDFLRFFLHNESREDRQGILKVTLCDRDFSVIHEDTQAAVLPALSAACVLERDYSAWLGETLQRRTRYVAWTLTVNGEVVSRGTQFFCKPKQFELRKAAPAMHWRDAGDAWELTLRSETLLRFVEVKQGNACPLWSDNYFDLATPEGVTLRLEKSQLEDPGADLEAVTSSFRIRHLSDTF